MQALHCILCAKNGRRETTFSEVHSARLAFLLTLNWLVLTSENQSLFLSQ